MVLDALWIQLITQKVLGIDYFDIVQKIQVLQRTILLCLNGNRPALCVLSLTSACFDAERASGMEVSSKRLLLAVSMQLKF